MRKLLHHIPDHSLTRHHLFKGADKGEHDAHRAMGTGAQNGGKLRFEEVRHREAIAYAAPAEIGIVLWRDDQDRGPALSPPMSAVRMVRGRPASPVTIER